MTVLLRCPCGKQLRVPEYATGRRIKCPSCDAIQTVPNAKETADALRRVRAPAAPEPGCVRFACACGKQMQAREEYAGRYSRCPDCQEDVLIPGEPILEAEEDLEAPVRIRADRPSTPAPRAREDDEPPRLRRPVRRDVDDPDEEDEDGEDRFDLRRRRRRRRVWPWVLAASLLLLLVVGGIGGYLWWNRRMADDLALVPGNASAFVSVSIADVWKGDYFQAVLAEARKVRPDLPDLAALLEQELGVGPTEVERATFVVPDFQSEKYWLIVRTLKPYDRDKLRGKLAEVQEQRFGTHTFFTEGAGEEGLAVYFHSDRIFLAGTKSGIRHALSQIDGPHVRGPLDEALRIASRGHSFVGAVTLPREPMQQLKAVLPPPAKNFETLLDTETVRMVVDMGPLHGKSRIEIGLTFPDRQKASDAKSTVEGLVSLARLALPGAMANGGLGIPPAQQAEAMKNAQQALAQLQVKQSGNDVRVEVEAPTANPAHEMVTLKPLINQLADQLGPGSSQNLRRLAQAMQQYQQVNGHLPPPIIFSKAALNKPLYSWRVELLPYLGEQQLYNEFHKDEPWNSPHNLTLLRRMPTVFATPGDQAAPNPFQPFGALKVSPPTTTRYQLFVGPRTPFEMGRPTVVPGSFPDGLSNTILIAEATVPVAWTRPGDIVYNERIPVALLLHRRLGGTFLVALADGSVRTLKRTISVQTLQQAVNPADGKPVGKDW